MNPLRLLLALTFSSAALAPAAEEGGMAALLEARFRALDKNGDGRVTREEAGDAPWFKRLDRADRGEVTLAELRAALRRLSAATESGGLPQVGEAEPTLPAVSEAPVAPVTPREGPRILRGAERGVGRLIADVAFTDLEGRPGKLSDYKDAPALVIALTSTSCPL
ncbi:MAG TPA: EF-hand domain-containing protein, partial [Opitutaceae bacterium]